MMARSIACRIPPGRVGAEPEPALVIELLDRLDQTRIAFFFNDIGKEIPSSCIASPMLMTNRRFASIISLPGGFIANHDPLAHCSCLKFHRVDLRTSRR